jgi:flagellar hook-length control protein FliK
MPQLSLVQILSPNSSAKSTSGTSESEPAPVAFADVIQRLNASEPTNPDGFHQLGQTLHVAGQFDSKGEFIRDGQVDAARVSTMKGSKTGEPGDQENQWISLTPGGPLPPTNAGSLAVNQTATKSAEPTTDDEAGEDWLSREQLHDGLGSGAQVADGQTETSQRSLDDSRFDQVAWARFQNELRGVQRQRSQGRGFADGRGRMDAETIRSEHVQAGVGHPGMVQTGNSHFGLTESDSVDVSAANDASSSPPSAVIASLPGVNSQSLETRAFDRASASLDANQASTNGSGGQHEAVRLEQAFSAGEAADLPDRSQAAPASEVVLDSIEQQVADANQLGDVETEFQQTAQLRSSDGYATRGQVDDQAEEFRTQSDRVLESEISGDDQVDAGSLTDRGLSDDSAGRDSLSQFLRPVKQFLGGNESSDPKLSVDAHVSTEAFSQFNPAEPTADQLSQLQRFGNEVVVESINETTAKSVTETPILDDSSGDAVQQALEAITESVEVDGDLDAKTLTLQLNPDELGSLKIQVSQSGQSIEAQILASEAAASDLLAAHRDVLAQALGELGFESAEIDVRQDRDFSGQRPDREPGPFQQRARRRSESQPQQTASSSSNTLNIVA